VWGGIENHVRWLAEAQATAGHDVTVLVTNSSLRSSYSVESGVRVLRAGRLTTVASTPLSLRLPLLVGRHSNVDLTHLHFPYPVGEVCNWFFGRSRRTIISYHCDIVRQRRLLRLYHPFLTRILIAADAIIVNNSQTLQSSKQLDPAPIRARCTVVPLGIPLKHYTVHHPESVALRQKLGAPLLLFVGALRYYKGVEYLIRALSKIPEAKLAIVGEGAMKQSWQSEAHALGLSNRVCFVGQVDGDSLPHYYQACDLFVLPSSESSEAFGLVQVEAMASGRPVIGTEVGTGTSIVNQHGTTGLVVPPRDPDALAAAINGLLQDEQLRVAMGQAAQSSAISEYGLDLMVQRIMLVYDRVLANETLEHAAPY